MSTVYGNVRGSKVSRPTLFISRDIPTCNVRNLQPEEYIARALEQEKAPKVSEGFRLLLFIIELHILRRKLQIYQN